MTLEIAYATVFFFLLAWFGGTVLVTRLIVWFIVDRPAKKDDDRFKREWDAILSE